MAHLQPGVQEKPFVDDGRVPGWRFRAVVGGRLRHFAWRCEADLGFGAFHGESGRVVAAAVPAASLLAGGIEKRLVAGKGRRRSLASAGTTTWRGAMAGSAIRWGIALGALVLAHAGEASAGATYKCMQRGKVVYTQIPCAAGAKPLGEDGKPRVNVRYETPPQTRAVIAKRAPLTPEARQECSALDHTLAEQEGALKSKGGAATLDDEMPLVRSKKRFRELKC